MIRGRWRRRALRYIAVRFGRRNRRCCGGCGAAAAAGAGGGWASRPGPSAPETGSERPDGEPDDGVSSSSPASRARAPPRSNSNADLPESPPPTSVGVPPASVTEFQVRRGCPPYPSSTLGSSAPPQSFLRESRASPPTVSGTFRHHLDLGVPVSRPLRHQLPAAATHRRSTSRPGSWCHRCCGPPPRLGGGGA